MLPLSSFNLRMTVYYTICFSVPPIAVILTSREISDGSFLSENRCELYKPVNCRYIDSTTIISYLPFFFA